MFTPVLGRGASGAAAPARRAPAGRPGSASTGPRADAPPTAAGPARADRDGVGGHGRWLVALTALALLTAAGTTLALVRVWSPGARGAAPAQPAGALAVRAQAAGWIAREVSRSAIIACDKAMCATLYRAGMPSANLLVVSPAAPDPLGADVIAATPALRALFGSRLATEYAPSVLASFGHARGAVAVRVIAAYGAAAYETALGHDLAARRQAGSQLLRNRRIAIPGAARRQLTGGRVDPRLLLTLAALAAQRPIRVLAFYDLPPGAGRGVPLSGVKLSGTDRRAGLTAGAYQRWLVSFLRSQNAPYRAAEITSSRVGGHPVVSVRFSRPSPLGLLH